MTADGEEKQVTHLGQVATKGTNLLLTGFMLLIVGIVFWGILVRYLPIYGRWSLWVQDMAVATLIWLIFIVGALITLQKGHSGGHYVVSVVFDRLPVKVRPVVKTIIEILTLALFAAMTVIGVSYCISVKDAQTINVGWPFLIFTIPVALGSLLIVVFIIGRLTSAIKKRFQG